MKGRRLARLGLGAVAAVALVGCGGGEDLDFEVSLPAAWEQRDEEFGAQAGQAGGEQLQGAGYPAGGIEPLRVFTRESDRDQVTSNITVFVERMPEGRSLRQVVDGGVAALAPIVGAELTADPVRGRLGGEPAFSFGYRTKVDGERLSFLITQALRDDLVYSVTLTTPEKGRGQIEKEYRRILGSWEWS